MRPGFGNFKRLCTVFFNHLSLPAVDILPKDATKTSGYCIDPVLTKLLHALQEQRRTIGTARTHLLHDNASAHKTRAITQLLEDAKIQILFHTTYSPDLTPCNFLLFPKLKEQLSGKKFYRVQDLAKAVNSELQTKKSIVAPFRIILGN